MTPLMYSIYGLVTAGCLVWTWAVRELFSCVRAAHRLKLATQRLEADSSDKDAVFNMRSGALARAASVARKVLDERPKGYHPDRDLRYISNEFASQLGRPRALAGLLIIIGLLMTLTNLRSAVNSMRNALEEPATGVSASASSTPRSALAVDRKSVV